MEKEFTQGTVIPNESKNIAAVSQDKGAMLYARYLSGETVELQNKAFNELYDMYKNKVELFVKYILYNKDDVEDATNETFWKLAKLKPKFDGERNCTFGTWLLTIAKRTAINYNDKFKKNSHLTIEDYDEDIAQNFENESIEKIDLNNAIKQLKDSHREVVSYKYFLGLKNKEIAEILGKSEKTIEQRIRNAKDELKTILEETKSGDS